jgi:hypothetical protein
MRTFLTTIEVSLMLNQTNQKIKLFEHQLISQTATNNLKASQEEAKSSYLAPLYSTNNMLIESYIQLVTYFV